MTSASPRVAVVGCGVIGRRRAEVVRSTGLGTVIAAADLDPARAAEIASACGCDAAADWHDAVRRDDVDVVIVATPHNWLAPVAIEALDRGKHVLVEKPMARTPAEARAILAAAARAGSPVVKVGFNHRHHAAVWRAHALVADGGIRRTVLRPLRPVLGMAAVRGTPRNGGPTASAPAGASCSIRAFTSSI